MSVQHPDMNRGNDILMLLFGLIIIVGLLLVVIWYKWHTEIVQVFIFMTWWSLPIFEKGYLFLQQLGAPKFILEILMPVDIIADLPSVRYDLSRIQPSKVKFLEFTFYVNLTGYVFRLLGPFLAIPCIWFVLKKTKPARLKRNLSVFELAEIAIPEFPHIRPAIMEDLLSQHPDEGYFRREASPLRFGLRHGLFKAFKSDYKGELINEIVIPTSDPKMKGKKGYEYQVDNYDKGLVAFHNRCILDREKTKRVFERQLGKNWLGQKELPPIHRGLYAALLAFVNANKDGSLALLNQFNVSWQPPTKKNKYPSIDLKGVDEIIEKYENTDLTQAVITKHAFVNTVFPALLQAARTKGKISTSLFLWLKVIDRPLWYAMSQEGGQCAWTEAAGARAHKLAEQSAKGPLFQPFVETAVDEFEVYMRDIEGWVVRDFDRPDIEQDN